MSSESVPMQHRPVYSISVASELTDVSPVMIREYEKAGLIRPARVHGKRRFTPADVCHIGLIRHYLSERQLTLNGLRVLFELTPCHILKNCTEASCPLASSCDLHCWETMQSLQGADTLLCDSCPLKRVRETGNTNPPLPEVPSASPED
jgi:DNA-binding transcriptional MerR regulator